MLLNDIRLALKDIYKDKILLVFYILFFACVLYTIISTTGSLVYEVKRPVTDKGDYTVFEAFLIGERIKQPEELKEGLAHIYGSEAFSYCEAGSKTYVFFGDPSGVYPYLKTEKDLSIFVGEKRKNTEKIALGGVDYGIEGILEEGCSFESLPGLWEDMDEMTFIVMRNFELPSWIRGDETEMIFEIIGNTHILTRKTEKIEEFFNCVGHDFVELRVKEQRGKGEELGFILGQMYPFLFILLLCYFLCSSIILDGVIKRRIKEFTLHLLQGARMRDIVLRFVLYYIFIIAAAITLCFWLGVADKEELWLYLLAGAAFITLISVMAARKLKKKDLNTNLIVGGAE